MSNEETLEVIDYIDRFQVLELLGDKADLFSEPPMDKDDFTKLKLVVELELEVRKLPTLECKEVKHGEWLDNHNGTFVCSVCRGKSPRKRWCGDCGAKMDGKDTNVPTK